MADIEIFCVSRDPKTKRIIEVGIRPRNKTPTPRLITVQDAILLRGRGHRLFVEHEGNLVPVEEVDGPNKRYLRTRADRIVEDNLDHLPTCSPTSDPILTGNSIDDFLQGKLPR